VEQASKLFAAFNDVSAAAQAEMLPVTFADDDPYEAGLLELASIGLSGDPAALCRMTAARGCPSEPTLRVAAGFRLTRLN